MALNEFGKAVRKARIDTGQTLMSMARELGVTASFLSAMETGRKRIGADWVARIGAFFAQHGQPIPQLETLADISNEVVPVEGLTLQHQMLVAGFAKSPYSAEELRDIAAFLERINSRKNNKAKHAAQDEGE